jgi:Xaa-Pro dipeptidase
MLIELNRCKEWLARCQLDAIIATSCPNVFYLTDYFLWIQPLFKEYMTCPGGGSDLGHLYGILSSQGERALVLDQLCESNASDFPQVTRYVFGASPAAAGAADTELSSLDIPYARTPHQFGAPLEALTAALDTMNLQSAQIGVDYDGFPPLRLAELKQRMPRAQFLDASNLFRVLRMVKSDEELRRMRCAAEISQRAALDCLALAKPGDQMLDVAQKYRTSVAAAGADFEHFAYSMRGTGIATEADYRLPQRETMFVDFGCIYQHYFSDAGVTLMTGSPPDRERSAYERLVECLDRGATLLCPGSLPSAVQAVMQRCLDDAGLVGNFPHGHGLGIEIRDYPILAPDNGRRIRDDCVDLPADVQLEAGMVLNLEAPLFKFGKAGFQLEQTYLVTDQGGVPLTNRDLSRPIVVG